MIIYIGIIWFDLIEYFNVSLFRLFGKCSVHDQEFIGSGFEAGYFLVLFSFDFCSEGESLEVLANLEGKENTLEKTNLTDEQSRYFKRII